MGFEITEHTADVGIHAWSNSLRGCFEAATQGLLEITGAMAHGSGTRVEIGIEARDLGALLVDWLSEVLYLQDARDALIAEVHVEDVTDGSARGWVEVQPRSDEITGTAVKAVTYHRLEVVDEDGTWHARVIVDV